MTGLLWVDPEVPIAEQSRWSAAIRKPDAIWFDNLDYSTPDYYVPKVLANNVGTRILPIAGPQHTVCRDLNSVAREDRAPRH